MTLQSVQLSAGQVYQRYTNLKPHNQFVWELAQPIVFLGLVISY